MDDIFSGLDRRSMTHIFSTLFSQNGLLEKLNCAAVLVTHSSTPCFLVDFPGIFVQANPSQPNSSPDLTPSW